jgi:hypothetical protein
MFNIDCSCWNVFSGKLEFTIFERISLKISSKQTDKKVLCKRVEQNIE